MPSVGIYLLMRRRAALVVAAIVLVAAGVLAVSGRAVVAWVLPGLLGLAIHGNVTVAQVHIGDGHLILRGVHATKNGDPLFDAPQVEVDYSLRDLLPGSHHRYGLLGVSDRSSGLHALPARRRQLRYCAWIRDAGRAASAQPPQPGADRVLPQRARWVGCATRSGRARSTSARDQHARHRTARHDQHRDAHALQPYRALCRRQTAAVLDKRNDRRNARLGDASCVRC